MPGPRIAVIGPGAIGAVFAAAVQQAGHKDMVLCARSPVGRITVDRDEHAPVLVDAPILTEPAMVEGPADWILLAVKAHQTEGASEWLKVLAAPGSVVVVLQNGVEHRERAGRLAGPAAVLPAVVWCPAETVGPGHVRLRGEPRLSVPAGPPGQALAGLLAGAARVDVIEDFTTEAWRKLCVNAVAGLMVLTGRRAVMYRQADIAALARDLAVECLQVARAEGARLPDSAADAIVADLAGMPPDLGSSILFDREAGRRLEWEARNGVVRRIGARHRIPTPVSDVIVPLLAAASGEE